MDDSIIHHQIGGSMYRVQQVHSVHEALERDWGSKQAESERDELVEFAWCEKDVFFLVSLSL